LTTDNDDPSADVPLPPEPPQDDDNDGRRSVAAQLVNLATADYSLGITDTDDPFGVTNTQPHIAMMLRGGRTGLRAELARKFFALTNKVASGQALADACMVLEGMAAQESPRRVYLRVGEAFGAVYIDVGDASGDVIEISGGNWKVTNTAPVLFRRTKLTAALPMPKESNADALDRLWEFVPVDKADRPLLLAVLVAALVQVDVPHPILGLLAEQGSAKSSITRLLVNLVDPSPVPVRQPPRDAEGWSTAASASWVVALDNLSGNIADWLSDSLCRAATGDGSVKRALYTDHDVAVVAYRRCVIFNGVDLEVTRGDLAERMVLVDLRRITTRRDEEELAVAWESAWPVIFGGLLDLAAVVHHRLKTIKVDNLPRMADFAKVLAAVDESLDTQGLDQYRDRSKRSAAETLDGPFIKALVDRNGDFDGKTSAEILAVLTPAEPSWKAPKGWPGAARGVTGQLTRHAPALRSQGWRVEHDGGKTEDGIRRWTISPPWPPEKARISDPSDPSDPSPQLNGTKPHGLTDGLAGHTSQDRLTDGSAEMLNPSEKWPSTSTNGLTGQTGQKYTPSLVSTQPRQYVPPRGPGRCDDCHHHIATQGHAEVCPQQRRTA
jgi:hypothetical protein